MKESYWLILKCYAVSSLVFLLLLIPIFTYFGKIGIIIALIFYLTFIVITTIKAWTQVPHNWVYIIERFGEYYEILNPGLHFVIPFFNFYYVKHKIFMGDMKMALFDEEVEESEDYKGGIVDFKDESAKIQAFFFFKVTNKKEKTIKTAAYKTADPISYIKATAEAALRSFLAQYDLLEANELKSYFDLNAVALMINPGELKEEIEKMKQDAWKDSVFGEKLIDWGFTPLSFIITEIQFPERVIEQRARLMKAKKDEKIALYEKKREVILSQGEAEALDNMSEARAREVLKLKKKTGVSSQEAFLFIVNRQKYEALARAGNVTWISGADEKEVRRGGSFGAGFRS